jgi:hypothetical protein
VAFPVVFSRAHVEGDELGVGVFDGGQLGGEPALAQDLSLIKGGDLHFSLVAGVYESGQVSRLDSPEDFTSPSSHKLCRVNWLGPMLAMVHKAVHVLVFLGGLLRHIFKVGVAPADAHGAGV